MGNSRVKEITPAFGFPLKKEINRPFESLPKTGATGAAGESIIRRGTGLPRTTKDKRGLL